MYCYPKKLVLFQMKNFLALKQLEPDFHSEEESPQVSSLSSYAIYLLTFGVCVRECVHACVCELSGISRLGQLGSPSWPWTVLLLGSRYGPQCWLYFLALRKWFPFLLSPHHPRLLVGQFEKISSQLASVKWWAFADWVEQKVLELRGKTR